MTVRRLILPVAAAVILAGCASATDGSAEQGSSQPSTSSSPTGPTSQPSSSSPTSSGPTSSSPTTSSPTSSSPTSSSPTSSSPTPTTSAQTGSSGAFPTTVDGLAVLLLKGNTSIKSAHLDLVETAGGTAVHGIGDETLSEGRVTAIDLSETVDSQSLRFVIIGSKVYAKVPRAIYDAAKPWVHISAGTTNSTLKSLYSSLQQSVQTGAGQQIVTFVQAAGPLQLLGSEQLDGVTVGHYRVQVSVAKLPATFEGKDALQKVGLTSVPVEIWVDQQGRTRKVTENLTVAGTTVDLKVTLTKIDQPVTIKAPPADQVVSG